jgi:hypothetical protein
VTTAFGEEKETMAEYGEWNRKGSTLSNVTAEKEYGVNWDFIVEGINAGKLEYREGSIWGNPYRKIIRRQLEAYIAERLGEPYLVEVKAKTELRQVRKDISELQNKLSMLQIRKASLEKLLKK